MLGLEPVPELGPGPMLRPAPELGPELEPELELELELQLVPDLGPGLEPELEPELEPGSCEVLRILKFSPCLQYCYLDQ